jgi:Cu/Ag efflux protein CusF
MKRIALFASLAFAASLALAQTVDGEVRRVDKAAKKITLKHGPIKGLDMPAMTMEFQVKDPAMLEKFRAGDRVRFDAEMSGGTVTVTKMEPAK